MSSNPENTENTEQNFDNPEIIPPQLSKNKVQRIFEQLEIMAMQKGSRNSLDISKLDKQQIDKLLDTLAENEKNAFAFHTKRIDAIKEIEIKKIDASVINQRTIKTVLIGVFLVVVPAITLLILFYKETYFIPWLTFLTGILGGFGLSKVTSTIFRQPETKNPINEKDEND